MRDELLRSMWETAVDAMLLLQSDGTVVEANPAYFALHGYAREEIIGRPFSVVFDPEERTVVEERFAALFVHEHIAASYEFQIRRKDGTTCVVDVRISFLEEDGRRSLMLAMLRDISERARSEDELRHSEEHFRLLIENALDIITIIEADGTIRYESPSIERVLGYEPNDLVGRNAFELIHPDDLPRVLEIYLDALSVPGKSAGAEFRFLNARGDWVYIEAIGTNLLEHPTVHGVVLNSRDVSARKRAEQSLKEVNESLEQRVAGRTSELALALQRLEEAHQAQKRFIADASHDLRTPLTVLRTELDLLAMSGDVSDDVADAIERMTNEVSLLDQLTSDMLMLARLDAERPWLRDVVGLDAIVENSIEFLSGVAAEKGLQWHTRLDPTCVVRGDARALGRAVRNVLENAIKYSHPATLVEVSLQRDGTDAVLEVSDEGVGIPDEDLERVFERFYRSDRTRTTPGSGLGLAIVRSVIEVHGGGVAITSGLDARTTVRMRLPLSVADRAAVPDGGQARS